VIESVAENSVDAVVAPAFWGLVAGAPGTLAYRSINTMDAMVGHRNERYKNFGWASARLDDVANYVPARCFVALVALAKPERTSAIWRLVQRDARHILLRTLGSPRPPLPPQSTSSSVVRCVMASGRSFVQPLAMGSDLRPPTLTPQ